MVTKMAKAVLPPSTQIQKEAIIAIQKSATVFISYLANQCVALSLVYYFDRLNHQNLERFGGHEYYETPLIS